MVHARLNGQFSVSSAVKHMVGYCIVKCFLSN